jgi:hypothetical protein
MLDPDILESPASVELLRFNGLSVSTPHLRYTIMEQLNTSLWVENEDFQLE